MSGKRYCTRRLAFDSAHRVMLHESKCKNLHGHRYVVEVTACSSKLDNLGRVIDFGVIKEVLGNWIDEKWDHGTIVNEEDREIINLCYEQNWKLYILKDNPTAENMAQYLYLKGNELLMPFGVSVSSIRVYETPNCWADFSMKEV